MSDDTPEEHRCSICTLWFVSTAGLKDHVRRDHGDCAKIPGRVHRDGKCECFFGGKAGEFRG